MTTIMCFVNVGSTAFLLQLPHANYRRPPSSFQIFKSCLSEDGPFGDW